MMMRVVRWIARLWRAPQERERADRELSEELGSYVELLTADKMAAGQSAREARRAALLELGGAEQVQERVRDVRAGALDYPGDPRQQATPRLAAVPTFADYRANRDPALDAILAWEPDRLHHDITTLLATGDTAAAAELIRAYNGRPVNRYRDASTDVNALGYRVLREGRLAEALAIFELNVRVHPHYTNGWDSLGEAYVQSGRRDDAIAAFRQALAIEPGFPPSREWLRRLGVAR
jgi:tetratricopeptide (TPR) repeat protein